MSRQEKLEPPTTEEKRPQLPAEDIRLQIELRLCLDKAAEVEAKELRASVRQAPTRNDLSRVAGRIFDARRMRERVLDGRVLGEPAWDILLALYCLPLRGEVLSVTSLSLAANLAPTTGLRWQSLLLSEGLIEQGPGNVDARRRMMRLTTEGRSLMERYLTKLFYCDTPTPPRGEIAGS